MVATTRHPPWMAAAGCSHQPTAGARGGGDPSQEGGPGQQPPPPRTPSARRILGGGAAVPTARCTIRLGVGFMLDNMNPTSVSTKVVNMAAEASHDRPSITRASMESKGSRASHPSVPMDFSRVSMELKGGFAVPDFNDMSPKSFFASLDWKYACELRVSHVEDDECLAYAIKLLRMIQ
eukprot:gene28083-31191_t